MMALGIIGNSFFQLETQGTLKPGESLTIKNYVVTYNGLRQIQQPTHTQVFAPLQVTRNGQPIGVVQPRKNLYFKTPDQPTSEVGLRIFPTEDLYAVLAGWDSNGDTASFKLFVNPLMVFLWIGGLVLALGTLVWLNGRRSATWRSKPSRTWSLIIRPARCRLLIILSMTGGCANRRCRPCTGSTPIRPNNGPRFWTRSWKPKLPRCTARRG